MLLHDRPESSDIRFGHKVISEWLAAQIESLPPPFRLAVTGGLGTGKSTILQAAIDQIQKDKKDTLAVSYVDVWKLDKESVRRSALIRIAKDLLKDPKAEKSLRETLYGTFSEASYLRPFRKTVDKVGLGIAGVLLIGTVFVTYSILSIFEGSHAEPWWWKTIVSLCVAGISMASRFLEKSVVHIQRIFNRAPMIGAEEFEEGLQTILDSHKLTGKLTIVVFDNIDRAAPESSRAILAGISAFFDHSGQDRLRNVLIIVPFDPTCLVDTKGGDRTIIDDCEKMFDAIVPLPKLTIEDLTDFAFDHLSIALEGFKYPEDVLQNLAFLVSFSPFKSPREIKHMVNQLVSRLSLAKAHETNIDNRLKVKSTLLPAGTITDCPDSLLKLLICEKIYPTFTESVVANGLELKLAFEPMENSLTKPMELDEKLAKPLLAFLGATIGIPKNPPLSAAAFLYMKGPDQVLAIPAGQIMSEALFKGDSDRVMEIIGKNEIKHDDLAAIVRFHRKKYEKNSQALKNCIRALLGGLNQAGVFDKSLVIETCEVLHLVPDMLPDLSPALLSKYTIDFLEISAVQRVWKVLDAEYKASLASDQFEDETNKNWAAQYLQALLRQTDGFKRAGIEKLTIPLMLLVSDEVATSLGDSYPGPYCSGKDTLVAAKQYLESGSEELSERYIAIVREGLSVDMQGEESDFQELATAWTIHADTWVKGANQTGNGSEKLSDIIYHWPTKNPKAKIAFGTLRDWVSARVAALQKISAASSFVDVVDLCVSFYSSGLAPEAHFDAIIQNSLTYDSCSKDALVALLDRNSGAQEFWKKLMQRAPQSLVPAIDKVNAYDLLLSGNAVEVVDVIVGKFPTLVHKQSFIEQLLASENKFPNAVELLKGFIHASGNCRIPLIRVGRKYKVEDSIIFPAMEYFVLNPDESVDGLFEEARSQLDPTTKKKLTDSAISSLTSHAGVWNDREARIFLWLRLIPEDITDSTLRNAIDVGLERGVQNGANENVKNLCTKVILDLWSNDQAFTEKSFKILKKNAPSAFAAQIQLIGNAKGVKDTFLEKAGSLLDGLTGKGEPES